MTNVISAPDVAGRVAVITGAGQGIGRAYANSLASMGARLVIAEIDPERAKAAAEEIRECGGAALGVATDVSDEVSVAAMRDQVLSAFGRVDILINNAALMSTLVRRPFWEIPPAEFDLVMKVNVGGAFRVAAALVPVMREAGWGRIVNMSSATVLVGHPLYLHYVASKAALQGMTRSMARELAGTGVTVNALLPGQIITEVENVGQTPEAIAKVLSRQIVQRSGRPEDLTGLLAWLASTSSDFVTGQSLVVDGGFSMM